MYIIFFYFFIVSYWFHCIVCSKYDLFVDFLLSDGSDIIEHVFVLLLIWYLRCDEREKKNIVYDLCKLEGTSICNNIFRLLFLLLLSVCWFECIVSFLCYCIVLFICILFICVSWSDSFKMRLIVRFEEILPHTI